MSEAPLKAKWDALCDQVTDRMKVFTRPYVTLLTIEVADEKTRVGTGTFLEKAGAQLLTCEHVARYNAFGFFINENGGTRFQPGAWRTELDPIDAAIAPIEPGQWRLIKDRARLLPMWRFAKRHAPVKNEVLFFRGFSSENAYVSSFGVDAIPVGYCSQEKMDGGTKHKFEILWEPRETSVTTGTESETRKRLRHDDPGGFSGSLVWNTRFVELGCDLSRWKPEDAVVAGLLHRWDTSTKTLLALRAEHLLLWLG